MPSVGKVNSSVTKNTSKGGRCVTENLKSEVNITMMKSEQEAELFDTQHLMVGIQSVGDKGHHSESDLKVRLPQINNFVRKTTDTVEEVLVETVYKVNAASKVIDEFNGGIGEKESPLATKIQGEIVGIKLVNIEENETPTVKGGSALCALENTKTEPGVEAINQMMEVVGQTRPTPERDQMSVDHVHNIQGRRCVITRRLERLKVDQVVETLSYNDTTKNNVTDQEMVRKILEKANAGDQNEMGLLLARGLNQSDVRIDMCMEKPKQHDSFRAQVRIVMSNTTRFIVHAIVRT